jgi:hypothetical protein
MFVAVAPLMADRFESHHANIRLSDACHRLPKGDGLLRRLIACQGGRNQEVGHRQTNEFPLLPNDE